MAAQSGRVGNVAGWSTLPLERDVKMMDMGIAPIWHKRCRKSSGSGRSPQAANRSSSRLQISASASASSAIIAAEWFGPGVNRRRSVPRGTVGKLIG